MALVTLVVSSLAFPTGFSHGSGSSSPLLLHGDLWFPGDELHGPPNKLFTDVKNVLPPVGFPRLIATLVFSLQHAAVACSTVILLNLNPLLIASCSNPLRAGILHFQLLLHYCWISLFQSWHEEKKKTEKL